MEAAMACWEIEQSLQSLTGVSPGEGTGATMSDDDDYQVESDANLFDGSLDGHDTMGFGPLFPTESERSLMERVRQELKHELKQGYTEKIVDIREDILRKRRAGKLLGQQVHAYAVKSGVEVNVVVGSSLAHMYMKSGSLAEGEKSLCLELATLGQGQQIHAEPK